MTTKSRESALDFLSGGNWPRTLAQGDAHWLSDELLTVLRMQDPPQEDLAERLAAALRDDPKTPLMLRKVAENVLGR